MSFPAMELRLAPWGIGHNHPVFLFLSGATLVILSVPAIFLLEASGRRAFMNQRGEQGADGDAEEAV